jgi:hypothetical protein
MAKKKRVKRVARRSTTARRKFRPIHAIADRLPSEKNRFKVVMKNLILFAVLFILSMIIKSSSSNTIVYQVFEIIAILTGFVVVALLIVLLILFFMKQMHK